MRMPSARAAVSQGVPTHAMQGDMTKVIFDRQSPWNQGGHGEISGVTTASAMQCLSIMICHKGWTVIHSEPVANPSATDAPHLVMWSIARTARGINV